MKKYNKINALFKFLFDKNFDYNKSEDLSLLSSVSFLLNNKANIHLSSTEYPYMFAKNSVYSADLTRAIKQGDFVCSRKKYTKNEIIWLTSLKSTLNYCQSTAFNKETILSGMANYVYLNEVLGYEDCIQNVFDRNSSVKSKSYYKWVTNALNVLQQNISKYQKCNADNNQDKEIEPNIPPIADIF